MARPSTRSRAITLYSLLLNFQRKRRLIALSGGSGEEEAGANLGYVEEAVLRVLDNGEDRNVKELSEQVGVERSWMSRVVASLVERNLIDSFTPPSDKRSKRLQITATGKEALRSLEDVVRAVITQALSDLQETQIAQLAECLKEFADGLGASPARVGRRSHPVHVQLNRISRALGVFGSNVMNSGLHLSQIHVLERVPAAGEGGVSINDLDAVIPLDVSTISRSVSSLVKSGLLRKEPSAKDKRSVLLSLSRKGEVARQKYHTIVDSVFEKAISQMPAVAVTDLFALLEIATLNIPIKSNLDSAIEIRTVSLKTALPPVRMLLEKAVGANGKLSDYTEHIVLFSAGEPLVACLLRRSGSDGQVEKMLVEGAGMTKEHCSLLLERCL